VLGAGAQVVMASFSSWNDTEAGRIPMSRIDDAVTRILRQDFKHAALDLEPKAQGSGLEL